MLENLRDIKAKYTALSSHVKEITATQKDSMDCIRRNLGSIMELMQHFQQTTDVEVQPLTESEQESAELLGSTVALIPTAVTSSVGKNVQLQPLGGFSTLF